MSPRDIAALFRPLAVVAVVALALVVAALAARSYRPFAHGSGPEREASTTFTDAGLTLALVAALALTVFGVLAATRRLRRPEIRRGEPRPHSESLKRLLLFCLFLVALVLVVRGLRDRDSILLRQPEPPPGATERPREHDKGATRRQSHDPEVIWPLALAAGGLIVAGVVAALVVVRRRRQPGGISPEAAAEIEAALEEAIEDLQRDPDARRAVIAAYARMERALGAHGLRRSPAETPYEYLARVARLLEAEDAMGRLTALFEHAKFSTHAVDEEMRRQAIEALTAVRVDVRAAT